MTWKEIGELLTAFIPPLFALIAAIVSAKTARSADHEKTRLADALEGVVKLTDVLDRHLTHANQEISRVLNRVLP